jgi:hypothetical protein
MAPYQEDDPIERQFCFYKVEINEYSYEWYNEYYIKYMSRFIDPTKIKYMKLLDIIGYIMVYPTEENYMILDNIPLEMFDLEDVISLLLHLDKIDNRIDEWFNLFVFLFNDNIKDFHDLRIRLNGGGDIVEILTKYPRLCSYFDSTGLDDKLYLIIEESINLFHIPKYKGKFIEMFEYIQEFKDSETKEKIISYILEKYPNLKGQ